MLQLSNIFYSIQGKPIFEDASAVIPTGHKVGVVGRNGTGKTTLFELIKKSNHNINVSTDLSKIKKEKELKIIYEMIDKLLKELKR